MEYKTIHEDEAITEEDRREIQATKEYFRALSHIIKSSLNGRFDFGINFTLISWPEGEPDKTNSNGGGDLVEVIQALDATRARLAAMLEQRQQHALQESQQAAERGQLC